MTAKRSYTSSCTLISEPEFQHLPPCIQRKYFSSLERLQIANNSAQLHLYCPPPLSGHIARCRSQSASTTLASRPNGIASLRQRLRKSHVSGSSLVISRAEAHWYRSLPDKVRRQHFSKTEQVLLHARADAASLLHSSPPLTSQDKRPRLSSQSRRHRRSFSEPPNISNRSSNTLSLQSVDLLGLLSHEPSPQPSVAMNCFDGRPSKLARKPSARRTLSISRPASGAMFRQSTSSGRTVPHPPIPPTYSQHGRNLSRTTMHSAVRPSIESASVPTDPAATYYQDPGARKKLRQYLASPQKFDEAVEFGFPSESAPVVDPDLFKVSRSTSGNDAQTFLKQDAITFLDQYEEDDSDDGSSDGGLDSPVTPADADVFHHPKPYGSSIFAGIDASDVPSLNFKFDQDLFPLSRFPLDPLANREMTLRMTLTRADLRANEDDLYGWTKKEDDPLALEELHITDDSTGAHGAFAVKQPKRRSGMFLNKLFSKVKTERRH